MSRIKVIFPGPWWNTLSYEAHVPVPEGVRVAAQLGSGLRVGLSLGPEQGGQAGFGKLRNIARVIDEKPVLGSAYLAAANAAAQAFLCSQADLLRVLLPSPFWKGEPFPEYAEKIATAPAPSFFYRYQDRVRLDYYRSKILSSVSGVLCLFSEREQARRFYASLVGVVPKARLILWPASGANSALKCWRQALEQPAPIIIGASGAVCAPMKELGLVIIDEESCPSWRSKSFPAFSNRSFAAARASLSGAELVMGGRLPSSKVFKNFLPPEQRCPVERGRVRFINLYDVPHVPFKGLQTQLPLADSLLSETAALTASQEVVFWLLDRRGVTGEIRCADCGQPVQCGRCGTSMVFEAGKLRCPLCGMKASLPERCPACGGRILQGASPGLESLLPLAQSLLGDSPVMLWHLDNPRTQAEAKRRISELSRSGGLVLGSRRALSLLDRLHPKLLCWLDADSEARQPNYASRFTAFSMMLESCWRGEGDRQVIMQTRSPGKKWQKGLLAGWNYFWQSELTERHGLNFPPDSNLVEIEIPTKWTDKEELAMALDDAGFTTMEPDTGGNKLIVLTPRIAPLRRVLAGYFAIQRSRVGFPRIQVWNE